MRVCPCVRLPVNQPGDIPAANRGLEVVGEMVVKVSRHCNCSVPALNLVVKVSMQQHLDSRKGIRIVPLVTHGNDHLSNAGKLGASYIIASPLLPPGCDQIGIH